MPVIYSKPNCVMCDATKRSMKKYGISYKEVNLLKDLAALEEIKSRGFQRVPVIDPGDGGGWWSGYDAAKIKSLAN